MERAGIWLTLIALTLIASDDAQSEQSAGDPDRLAGWYELTTDNRLIPVFKIEGTYYTVMSRGGFEVPLKECSDGLQWPSTLPSSMVGTKIGFDEESKQIYLSIVDQNREYQDPSFTSGKKQSMTAISKPSWLHDATAQPARTYDDFVGWYEAVWCPYVRGQVRREGEKYLLAVELLQIDGEKSLWAPQMQSELTPLPNRMGFAMRLEHEEDLEREGLAVRLVYNRARRRFEIQLSSAATESHVSRMPLARIPSPSPERDATSLPPMKIGIPSWD